MHVGQTGIAALEFVGQAFVIDAEHSGSTTRRAGHVVKAVGPVLGVGSNLVQEALSHFAGDAWLLFPGLHRLDRDIAAMNLHDLAPASHSNGCFQSSGES
jgi:hypothetical protein